MDETVLGVIAATWGVLMALSPIIQIRRMIVRRSSQDVSVGYLAVLSIGFAIWLVYGTAIDNLTLVIPNSLALIVGVATIAVARRFRGRKVGPTG
jgi:MtN3 and saliva related transmembrane protein